MFQYQDIDPVKFDEFLPRETFQMAEWLQDKLKIDREKRADMIAHIRNAPHFSRNDKKPWKYQDFLPDGEDEGVSPEEFEQIMLGLVE